MERCFLDWKPVTSWIIVGHFDVYINNLLENVQGTVGYFADATKIGDDLDSEEGY